MKKHAIAFLFLLVLLAAGAAQAAEQDFHMVNIGSGSVSRGDAVTTLISELGEPAYKETHDRYHFREGSRTVTRKNVHLWYYPDPSREGWMYRMVISGGQVARITKIYD